MMIRMLNFIGFKGYFSYWKEADSILHWFSNHIYILRLLYVGWQHRYCLLKCLTLSHSNIELVQKRTPQGYKPRPHVPFIFLRYNVFQLDIGIQQKHNQRLAA